MVTPSGCSALDESTGRTRQKQRFLAPARVLLERPRLKLRRELLLDRRWWKAEPW